MTTTPVHTITDEQIAELEFQYNETQKRGGAVLLSSDWLGGLIARLREAEKDADRYRWLRNDATNLDSWSPAVAVTDGSYVSYCLDGCDLDEEIDTVMQGDK